jgi:hypothetical protein
MSGWPTIGANANRIMQNAFGEPVVYQPMQGGQAVGDPLTITAVRHARVRCLKVLTVNENRATLGFLDEAFPGRTQTASEIAFWNNQREHMWGVSPRDSAVVVAAMTNYRPLVVLSSGTELAGFRQYGAAQYFSGFKLAA